MKVAFFHGFLGGAALLALYFLIMGLASGSWEYTVGQLIGLRYWIGALVLGFSIQIGLFSYLKNCHKTTKLESGAAMTGVGTSSVAMLACCAHHATDILPFIGWAAVSITLVKYQTWFLILGIVSNVVGILLMVRLIWRMKR